MQANRINSLDSTLFTIKGWTVTLVSGLVGFAFTKKCPDFNQVWLILAIAATATFMIVDIAFRRVQLGHVEITIRIKNLLKEKAGSSRSTVSDTNIWESIWSNEPDKERNTRNFAQIIKDYGFLGKDYGYVLIFYILVIVIGLIYLISHPC
jgi:hypothetical protein